MKASIFALVGAAAVVSAWGNDTGAYTTSTKTSTHTITISECAPTVTNCPYRTNPVTTEIVDVYTTYCPVEATETSSGVITTPASSVPAGYTTSTVYSTETLTISECAETVTNCPYKTHPITTVTSSAVSTTICPISTPVVTGKPSGSVVPPPYSPSVPPMSSAPAPPPYSSSKPAGILSTMTISTCVPTTYVSVITVTPSASQPAGAVGTGVSPPPKSNSTIPFTGAASAQKAGGLLMAVGLVAALL